MKNHCYISYLHFRYQEYLAIEERSLLFRLPTGMALDYASLLGCSGLTSYSSVVKCIDIIKRDLKIQGIYRCVVVSLSLEKFKNFQSFADFSNNY